MSRPPATVRRLAAGPRPAVAAVAVLLLALALLPGAALAAPTGHAPATPIHHFIVLMQENHTFDNYFGTYPGADGLTASSGVRGPGGAIVRPFHIGTRPIHDLAHDSLSAQIALNGGRMDGFIKAQARRGLGTQTMGYYNGSDIPFYWNIADRYVLFDHFFTSALSASFINHVYWVAGKAGNATQAAGRPPLHNVKTIFDSLQQAGVSWKFYVQNYDPSVNYRTTAKLPNPNQAPQVVWNPLLDIPRFLDNPALNSHIVDLKQYFNDLHNGTLPQVAYIVPSSASEHPPGSLQGGQRFVRGLINSLMTSDSWTSSAFLVAYDDWGGWYDHVRPPHRDANGDGFRTPALLVSPYARRHFIDHTTLDFTSILKFIEQNWRLKPLTRLDGTAGSMIHAFNFAQAPRPAAIIPFTRDAGPVTAAHRHLQLYALYAIGFLAAALLVGAAFVSGGRGRRTGEEQR